MTDTATSATTSTERSGPRQNVIKIRPPLVFTEAHADRVAAELDLALATEMG